MSEIEKALAELKALMKYRAEQLGHEEDFRGLGLTSRKNLCLHPSVKREKSGAVVDARCRSLTAGFVKEKKERGEDVELCVYHDVSTRRIPLLAFVIDLQVQNLDHLEPHNLVPNGVWTLDGLLRYGEQHKQCPYFTSRRMVGHSSPGALQSLMFLDAILQRHHLLLPLPPRP
jgi:DNA excision repair protein ERCC-2